MIKTTIVNEIMVLGEVPGVMLMMMWHVDRLVVVLMILKAEEDLLVIGEVMTPRAEEDLLVIVEEMILKVVEDHLVIAEVMTLRAVEDHLVIVEEMTLIVVEDHLVIVVMMILTVEEDLLVSAVMMLRVGENHLVNLEEDLVSINEMMNYLKLVIINYFLNGYHIYEIFINSV